MCEPTTLMVASLAITAASTAASLDTQRKTGNQQADAIQKAQDLQALDAARQQTELGSQGAEAMNDAARRSQAQLATLDAISGEYGGGLTADRGRAVAGLQSSENLATVSSNSKSAMNEAAAGAYANQARSQSQLNAIQRPSVALAGLQLGASALDAYNRYDANRPGKTSKSTK